MKIGLVCPYAVDVPGGVQNQVLGLAGHFSRAGDQVAIIAPGRLSDLRLRAHGLRSEQFTSAGPAIGIRYNGSTARVNPGPRAAARVRAWLKTNEFDVLHLHEPLTPSIGLPALKYSPAPVVGTFHTAIRNSHALRLAGHILTGCMDKITTSIAVSHSAREVVREYYGRNPIIIPNGFHRADFTSFNQGPAAEGRTRWRRRPRIVFLGRLNEPRKGLSVLLSALPQLRQHHFGLDVVIAGQGRYPIRGQGRIQGRRWSDQIVETGRRGGRAVRASCYPDLSAADASVMSVQVVGEVSDSERAWLLSSADLFIAPHTDRESFGIVLLEAMAAGATVVASDLAPFTELLSGSTGPLGFSFRAGDPDGLVAAIEQALHTDRTLMNQHAVAATARFDWATVGGQIHDAYRAALATRPLRQGSKLGAGSPDHRAPHRPEPKAEAVSLDTTDMRRVGR